MQKILIFFKMIKIEHSLFALPFALSSMLLAANGLPSVKTTILIILCMVTARSGAMGFNRLVDAAIDARNPRTANREIPSGNISKANTAIIVIASFALFTFGTYFINKLTFKLSWLPIFVFILYSYTKRFTSYCHIVLGIALAMAPVGAWIAVTGVLDIRILILSAGVLFWCAGFDFLYALQDLDFDIKEKLYSIPVKYGTERTLVLARYFHVIAAMCFLINGFIFSLGIIYFIAYTIALISMFYEHLLIKKYGIEKINKAFFDMNVVVSVVLFAGTVIPVCMK